MVSQLTHVLCIFTAVMVVVKVDGLPYLCKTEVFSCYTGVGYWGLNGITVNTCFMYLHSCDGGC